MDYLFVYFFIFLLYLFSPLLPTVLFMGSEKEKNLFKFHFLEGTKVIFAVYFFLFLLTLILSLLEGESLSFIVNWILPTIVLYSISILFLVGVFKFRENELKQKLIFFFFSLLLSLSYLTIGIGYLSLASSFG